MKFLLVILMLIAAVAFVNGKDHEKTEIASYSYDTIEKGDENSKGYRMFFLDVNGVIVSPFHDIPLYYNQESSVMNMVVEIPRWTNAKMEIDTKGEMNPIKQEVTEEGELRYVKNSFPYHGYLWNYGAFPQTWEDPNVIDAHTERNGTNGGLDVCEIGQKVQQRGAVVAVKVLGILAVIHDGKTDWKVITINILDPLATQLNDIDDVQKIMPGFIDATKQWLRIYQIPDGKLENQFDFNGDAQNKEFAMGVIGQTHEQWQQLVGRQVEADDLSCVNTAVHGSPDKIPAEDAEKVVTARENYTSNPGSIPDDVEKWHFVKA